jgi:hypothetical protein
MKSVKFVLNTEININGEIWSFNNHRGTITALKLFPIVDDVFTIDTVKEMSYSELKTYFETKGIRLNL